MKKLIIALCISASLLCGCSNSFDDINVTHFDIISVTPRGINELYAMIELGIKNPMMSFTLQDLEGTIKMDGQPCIRLGADQLIIDGNSDKVYAIPVKGKLSDDFNPWQLLELMQDQDFSRMTVDATAKVSLRSGIGKNIVIKDMPLEKLLKQE